MYKRQEGDKLVSAGVRFATPESEATMAMQLYAGPKEYDTLKRLNVGLEDTIDFGWFVFGSWGLVKAVAKPIFYVLRFLYEFTHNYGITIILLTMLIKLMFVPLQYKSYKSMKQMQVIQPKVLALQTKFKDDRERLNKEPVSYTHLDVYKRQDLSSLSVPIARACVPVPSHVFRVCPGCHRAVWRSQGASHGG